MEIKATNQAMELLQDAKLLLQQIKNAIDSNKSKEVFINNELFAVIEDINELTNTIETY